MIETWIVWGLLGILIAATFGLALILVTLISMSCYDTFLNDRRAVAMIKKVKKHTEPVAFNRLIVETSDVDYKVELITLGTAHISGHYDKKTHELTDYKLSKKFAELEEKHPQVRSEIESWLIHAKDMVIPVYEKSVFTREQYEKKKKEEKTVQKRDMLQTVNQKKKTK